MQKSLASQAKKEQKVFPDKLFYKIGEVSKIASVEPYVLRYWETEFPFLKPRKSKSGQRIYVKKDLDLIFEIKDLLYKERFTIEGVRKRFSEGGASKAAVARPRVEAPQAVAPPVKDNVIEHVKLRLREILEKLD